MGLKEELANAKDAGEKAAKDAVAGGKKLLKNVGETVGEKAADVKQKAAEVGQEIVEGGKKAGAAVEEKVKDIAENAPKIKK
ncbi:MAG: hypothetical protein IJM13_05830 [Lachnospiraceae bacterium]|nr:hypothetical protein [Lachnospiraceae bacterium]MBR0106719.1 hypothetical protein [Lachnospiraceae bacterium]